MENINYPKSYVVFDLETSGLDPIKDRILEIGAMVVRDGETISEHSWILNWGIEIPQIITDITGITKEIIDKEGKDPERCILDLITLIADNGWKTLTHNGIKFDIPFLVHNLMLFKGYNFFDTLDKLNENTIDTAVIVKAKKLGESQKEDENFYRFGKRIMDIRAYGVKFNVALCCDEMGIDRTNIALHRAGADVYLTNEIYKKLIK